MCGAERARLGRAGAGVTDSALGPGPPPAPPRRTPRRLAPRPRAGTGRQLGGRGRLREGGEGARREGGVRGAPRAEGRVPAPARALPKRPHPVVSAGGKGDTCGGRGVADENALSKRVQKGKGKKRRGVGNVVLPPALGTNRASKPGVWKFPGCGPTGEAWGGAACGSRAVASPLDDAWEHSFENDPSAS